MDSLYNSWFNVCNRIVENREISWKRDTDVYYMLEHVPGEYANIYLDLLLKNGISIETIQAYTDTVDTIGNANRHPFIRNNKTLLSSTTCLRYLYHALDILENLQIFFNKNIVPTIVEIGGGYGGLAVAINYMLRLKNISHVLNYIIIDLTNVQKLQAYYTSSFQLNQINISFIDSKEYGKNINSSNIFIISNYCLAEMGESNRQKYKEEIFTNRSVIGGYLQWNSGAPVYFLNRFKTEIKDEYPMTGPDNKTITFYNL
jgi:hypothetical protein